jgi:NADPH:quinone reductase-like Zn-dependent oxidoreductase
LRPIPPLFFHGRASVHTMKALVQDRYGSTDYLELMDIERPPVDDGEVLIRVHAAAVNPLDFFTVQGGFGRIFFGLRKPKQRVRGVDVAGVVERVGNDVKTLRPGDAVFGGSRGAFAEYACASENEVAPKPANLSFEQAAAVPIAGTTALQALRTVGNVQPGQTVLINGAAGGVGIFAVQIAKAFGAEVTGVCSTNNADLVRSIGADHVIDYTRDDFTRSGQRYDLIIDNVGNHSLSKCRRVLSVDGTLILNSGRGGLHRIVIVLALSRFVRQRLRFFIAKVNRADLVALSQLMESGKVTSVIDRSFPLSEADRAIAYVGAGHARGKVVISVADDPPP